MTHLPYLEAMITLTKDEMLRKWMLLTRSEPLLKGCTVSRSYGIDIEALCADEMRLWYINLLRTAEEGMVPVTDIAAKVQLTVDAVSGHPVVTLPVNCIRALSVTLAGWERPAPVIGPDTRTARMQVNPFACGGVCRPVAVLRPGGREIELFSAPTDPSSARIASLQAVMAPGDDTYTFSEDAIATIKEIFRQPAAQAGLEW